MEPHVSIDADRLTLELRYVDRFLEVGENRGLSIRQLLRLRSPWRLTHLSVLEEREKTLNAHSAD